MKKNKMMRVASALLVAVLLTTCAISGTFAKYVSQANGFDTARVAKWEITLEGEKLVAAGSADTVAFELFDYTDSNVDVDGAADNAQVIAPGTSGSFQFDLVNNSEVNAQYTISFTEQNDYNIPLQYSVDGTTWKDSIAELAMAELTDQAIAMNGGTENRTIYWRWVFEGTTSGAHAGQTDANDTALGLGGTASVTIYATVVVEQVD